MLLLCSVVAALAAVLSPLLALAAIIGRTNTHLTQKADAAPVVEPVVGGMTAAA